MGRDLAAVDQPGLDLRAYVIEVEKPVLVEALVAKFPVEALDVTSTSSFVMGFVAACAPRQAA